METTGVLVAEAGTGTGKTFAYLVPALLAGGKVIVSTGTKTLQDQLFDRDLPAVRSALSIGASAALLKGRSNYVCLYRLRRAVQGGVASPDDAVQLHHIQHFAAVSATGDRADLADVPEDAPVWATPLPRATTASGRDVRTMPTASSCARGGMRSPRTWS